MKKIFVIAATMIGVANLSAQEKTEKIQLGIKSTFNMSSFNGKDANEYLGEKDYKPGFSAGLYAHIPFSQEFAIQPEVNFSRIGAKSKDQVVEYGDMLVKTKQNVTLDYVQVPVMFKYYPGGSRFNVEVGPQVGFNLYASKKTVESSYVDGTVYNEETKAKIKDDIKKVDFGVNFGLGYNLTDNLNVGARYYMGITKIGDSKGQLDGANIKNHSFSVGVGYSF